ncbi:MAG: methylated-DNA--[protein]-cysteine S-methyltransferase [Candidatus Methylomirabilales bacterium]
MQGSGTEYNLLKTNRGWIAVAYSGRGILALTLPADDADRALRILRRGFSPPLARGNGYGKLARDLDCYFRREPVTFDYPLDLARATPFQRRVWVVLREIPYGVTQSYGDVAKAIGMPLAARAVGQAVGASPIPLLIPCHRVLASDGSLGGYAWGLTWKRRLLQIEGISPPWREEDRVE